MIVNPQLFKSKLISGGIIAGFSLLTIFGISKYKELQVEHSLLAKENSLLENELSYMIDKFDEELTTTESLHKANFVFKDSLKNINAEISNLASQLNQLSKYKKQATSYNKLYSIISSEKETLKDFNSKLKNENDAVKEELQVQQEENLQLVKEAVSLKSKLEEKKIVAPMSMKASAMSASFLGKKEPTIKASKAKVIDVEFSLDANVYATSGIKEFYIQVIDPDNNIIEDKGAVSFEKSELIYSLKKAVNYNNLPMAVKARIKNNTRFKRGLYHINVFHSGERVCGTKLLLK